IADYLEIIERKTASLFAAGARTAAHLAGAPAALLDAMGSCGRHVGLAFQVSDDLLDVEGQPAVTGKPRGIDLRDGNPSLPIVLAVPRDIEGLDAAARALGGAVLGPREITAALGFDPLAVLTPAEQKAAARLPFGPADLERARAAGEMLVLRVPRDPEGPLTMLRLA